MGSRPRPGGRLRTDRGIVLLGMGGSAMAATVGTLAATSASADPRSSTGATACRGGPPMSAASVIAVSYSGNTEEVLVRCRCGDLPPGSKSRRRHLRRPARRRSPPNAVSPYVLVPGGIQPRAGVGYQTAAVTRDPGCFRRDRRCSWRALSPRRQMSSTASSAKEAGAAVRQGSDIASKLAGSRRPPSSTADSGSGLTAAYRWKTQINENAKVPAFSRV